MNSDKQIVSEFREYILELKELRRLKIHRINSMDPDDDRVQHLILVVNRINQDIARSEKILEGLLS